MSYLLKNLAEVTDLEKVAGSLPPGFNENKVQVQEGYSPEKENDGSVKEEKSEEPAESEKSDSKKDMDYKDMDDKDKDKDDKKDEKEAMDKTATIKSASLDKVAARLQKYADFKEAVVKCAAERTDTLNEAEKDVVSGAVNHVLTKLAAAADWDTVELDYEDVLETVRTASAIADSVIKNFRRG